MPAVILLRCVDDQSPSPLMPRGAVDCTKSRAGHWLTIKGTRAFRDALVTVKLPGFTVHVAAFSGRRALPAAAAVLNGFFAADHSLMRLCKRWRRYESKARHKHEAD